MRKQKEVEETDRQRVERVLKEGPRMPRPEWTKQKIEQHCLALCEDLKAFQRYIVDLALDRMENY